jgi:hypothetical protein
MKYAIEIGLVVMIYITSFIKLMGGRGFTGTQINS